MLRDLSPTEDFEHLKGATLHHVLIAAPFRGVPSVCPHTKASGSRQRAASNFAEIRLELDLSVQRRP